MVAQVAALDPDTAAKIVQPTTLVCSRRPGSRVSQGASPWNMSSDSLVRNRISPIQMKSGSAVNVHEDDARHSTVIITSPTGRVVNSSIPTQATPISARPTQTPEPSRTNRTNRNRMMIDRSSIRVTPRRWGHG